MADPRQGEQRRKAILRYIRSYSRKHDRPPTVREIGDKVGLSSPNSTHRHLRVLQDDGFIKITPVIGRGISLVDPAPDGWTTKVA